MNEFLHNIVYPTIAGTVLAGIILFFIIAIHFQPEPEPVEEPIQAFELRYETETTFGHRYRVHYNGSNAGTIYTATKVHGNQMYLITVIPE
jgi:hypothetical protein